MAILVQDSFNRGNNTSSLGIADTGQTWEEYLGGNIGINSNQAYNSVQGDSISVIDSGVSDGFVQYTHVVYHAWTRIIWRFSSTTNYWRIEGATVQKVVNSGVTNVATLSTTPKTGDVLKVKFEGNVHTVYLNGVQAAQITDSHNQTATKCGFLIYTTSARVDDFSIESLTSSYTDGSITYDTKQSIYSDSSTTLDTIQTIYSDSSVSFDTKQTVYLDSSVGFDTKQSLYSDSQTVFDTKQSIYSDSYVYFDTQQVIQVGGDGSISFDTQQTIYEDSYLLFDTKQSVYREGSDLVVQRPVIIGSIQLKGIKATSDIRLKGNVSTTVYLKGGIQ